MNTQRVLVRLSVLFAIGLSSASLCATAMAASVKEGAAGQGNGVGVAITASRLVTQDNPAVVPPNASVMGKSYAEWGAEWWKWDYSIPAATSPTNDPTGQYGTINQSGSVWFLAGGVPTTRYLTVPRGTFLFFPLINVLNDYPCPLPNFEPEPGQSLENFLTYGGNGYFGAVDYINPTTALSVELDGRAIGSLFDYRATSKLLTFTADPSLAAGDPCVTGTPQQGVADGYWLMLKPLTPGAHTLHFLAINPFFSQEETYHLTVGGVGRMASRAAVTPVVPISWGRVKTVYR